MAAVFREEAGRLAATLVASLGDFQLAEDILQEALVTALERWPAEGIPRKPGAWLFTVARNRATDLLRRNARYREKLAELELPATGEVDDRLRLMFTCCHPAISREAQVALTLRTVCGFSVEEIAHAFLTSEAAIAQRLVRARRKIAHAGIPYRVPRSDELEERLSEVLAVLYLVFNEGYLASSGDSPERRDLTADAEWLASLLDRLLPNEPEVMGLLALIRLHRARAEARFDERGRLVLLRDQDRSRWDHAAIGAACELVLQAGRMRRPGPYQVQAAIVACHAEAPSWEATDWPQILALYDQLLRMAQSPVLRLNRAIALRFVAGPEAALAEVEGLAGDLGQYRLFHATRAEILRDLGRHAEARLADERALELTANPAERALLEQRLG
ncbi:MAG TPA: sigma-70 family RNA polymerase sigma factor [Chloroflexota bacterium]|nr:sigma-70 family RNA polymerase sigma factor [Chloroflexota bacterium]